MDQSAPSQPTRHPIFHAGPSEATTSLKKQPYTPQLPLEVWEQIGSGLSTLGMLKLSRIFGYRLPRDKDNHSRVWNAIFEDINWVDRATKKFGISPVIISQDLDRYYYQRGRRGPIYMVIALRDPTGDLKFDAQEFFDALRKPNHLDRGRREVTFEKSGIVLNVHDVICSHQIILVEPTQLIHGKRRLRTQYILWSDPDYKLMRAKLRDFAGPYISGDLREKVRKTKDQDFICEMSLTGPGDEAFRLWFGKRK
jgi:hypothetical protein